jgi:low affinity Fe/Cu permease
MKSKRSSPKFSSNSSNILSNKYVLYASFFFAIITAANYLLRNNLEAIGIFIIIGLLTTFFSKNMIVVLLTTTILTNFLVMFRNRDFSSIMMMEGFTTEEITKLKALMDDAKAAMDKETDDAKKAELKTKYEEAKKTHDDAVAAAAVAAVAAGNSTVTPTVTPTVTSSDTVAMGAQPANTVQQPLTSGKGTIKDGMSQLSPAPVGGESINPMMQAAATGSNAQKEQALSVLSNMGGNGDMVAQQNEMINNLKSIEPILNTAQSFLDKFENSSISKMFSGSGGFPGMSLLTGGAGGNKTSPAPVGS